MNKIYNDSKDVFVSAVVVYAGTNNKADVDASDDPVQFEADELMDAFVKGCIISASGAYYKPVFAEEDSETGVVTLTYIAAVTDDNVTTLNPEVVVSKAKSA